MLKKYLNVCALFGLLQISTAATNYGSCMTPNNEISFCIDLTECSQLYRLARKSDFTADERNFLGKSQCGYKNKTILVCCPPQPSNDQSNVGLFASPVQENYAPMNNQPSAIQYGICTTPKNETSSCIELTECESLNALLQKSDLTAEERTFLRESQCGYKDEKILVCCPPRAGSLLPQAPDCGTTLANRVIGGNVTAIDEYPWMAFIESMNLTTKEKGFYCGGTLINTRYVMTAAHCLWLIFNDFRVTSVRLGEWDLDMNPDCQVDTRGKKYCAPPHMDVPVEQQIAHPQYNPNSLTRENDIALLRLSRNIIPNNFIMPICLPFDESFQGATFLDREMDVAGWGSTKKADYSNIKLKATLKITDFERCRQKYKSQQIFLRSTQMCAGGYGGVDSCLGDSGGPLISEENIKNRSAFFLMGVVSFGPHPCALRGWPGVYTRVADYKSWVESNIRP